MLELNRTKCCGLRELHGIQCIGEYSRSYQHCLPTAKQIVAFVKVQMNGGKDGAFITFAAADGHGAANKQGEKLAAYITKYELGELSELECNRNPNSGHMLTVWLWRVASKVKRFIEPQPKVTNARSPKRRSR